MFIGRRSQIGIALEGTPGVAATPTHYIPFLECSLLERHTPISDSQAKGVRDVEGSDSVEGKKWGEGNIKVILDPTTAPYWLALALGEISAGNFVGGKYIYTITQKIDNEPLTATIWRGRVVDELEFVNSVVNSLELNFADDVVSLEANILSKYPTAKDESPSDLPELKYFTFRNALLSIGTAESLESPSEGTTYKVKEFTLTIENDAELIYAPNNNDVDRIASKGFKVTGKFKILFENEIQKDAFRDVAKQAMILRLEDADGNRIEFDIPLFRIDNWDLDTSIDDLAEEGIEFVAEYSEVDDKTISAEVINEVDEYPES
jgi:hypothetical protein